MQTAGMLRGTRAISLLALLVHSLIGCAHSSPLQYLPSIPGYVPVYIRYGDEPLEDINPDLAEAFAESSNSIKKLNTLVRESDSDDDDDGDDGIDAFLEEPTRKHAYPLHVRETEGRSFASVDDEPASRKPNKPKLLTIYELPDDNEGRPRRRYRGRTRTRNSKPPAFKVSPLSDAEREELEKLAIQVEKEETKPNELYVPSSEYPESPLGEVGTHDRHNSHNFATSIKVRNPLDESSAILPEIPRVAESSGSSDKRVITAAEAEEKEPPVKEQRPVTILANVDKLSPIDLPDENKTSADVASEAAKPLRKASVAETTTSEKPQILDPLKGSRNQDVASETEQKEPIKVQRPATILSNVDKLSPVDSPDDSDIDTDDKRKDSTEPNDEIATE